MRRLAWVLVLASAGCFVLAGWPALVADPPPRRVPPTASAALAIARKCVKDHGYRGAGGSALELARATASPWRFGRWLVHVPEARESTRPTGRDLLVDVVLRTCRTAPMD